jgi:RNA polymerase sigma-70 factor (ECF subfamily)
VDGDERDLVARCLAGHEEAGALLIERHARMVGTVIWRAIGNAPEVDDLAQETFLRVFRALPYYDGRARLSTWIYTIAHRVAIDHLRRRRRNVEEPFAADGTADDRLPSADTRDPEAILAREELEHVIREALARLPEKYRLPLVYAAIDGLDYATIAAMLGIPIGTVKTLIFRAKRLIREDVAVRVRIREDDAHEV